MLSIGRNLSKKKARNRSQTSSSTLSGGKFRLINETFYTESSEKTLKRFKAEKNMEWAKKYHEGYADQMVKWPCHPLDKVIPWIRDTVVPDSLLLDMGAGSCRVWRELQDEYTVISVDFAPPPEIDLPPLHDSLDEYKKQGGFIHSTMKRLQILPNESVNGCCIFSLSLMGLDWPTFLEEGLRIMGQNSFLVIAEIASRISDTNAFSAVLIEKYNLSLQKMENVENYFTILYFRKESRRGDSESVPVHNEKIKKQQPSALRPDILKPCLYNKRRKIKNVEQTRRGRIQKEGTNHCKKH